MGGPQTLFTDAVLQWGFYAVWHLYFRYINEGVMWRQGVLLLAYCRRYARRLKQLLADRRVNGSKNSSGSTNDFVQRLARPWCRVDSRIGKEVPRSKIWRTRRSVHIDDVTDGVDGAFVYYNIIVMIRVQNVLQGRIIARLTSMWHCSSLQSSRRLATKSADPRCSISFCPCVASLCQKPVRRSGHCGRPSKLSAQNNLWDDSK